THGGGLRRPWPLRGDFFSSSEISRRGPRRARPAPQAMTAIPRTLGPDAFGPASPLLDRIRQAIEGPAWLVGGAVRDALLGTPVADLDLTLPGGSLAAARRLADRLGGAFVRLSEPHGVARVVLAGRTPAPPTQIDLADLRGPTL